MKAILSLSTAFILLTGCHVQKMAVTKPKQVYWVNAGILVVGVIIIETIKFKTN